MQLNDLPDDILAIVLRASLAIEGRPVDSFSGHLPLLSVCWKWRYLALPMVYRTLYIQCGSLEALTREGPIANFMANGGLENVSAATNIDLVVAVGCAEVVRQVVISIYYMANPFPGLRALVKRMSSVADKWKGVQALELFIKPGIYPLNEHHANVADHMGNINEIGDALAAMFPQVRELRLIGTLQNPIAAALYSRLAGEYPEQLHVLHSNCPIVVPHDWPFTQLRDVNIKGSGIHGYHLPHMLTWNLERLSLAGLDPNHSWAPLSVDSHTRTIEFPKLRSLRVTYHSSDKTGNSAEQRSDGHPWVLQLPALKSLDIWQPSATPPLLKYARLPPHMESIEIMAGLVASKSITSVMLLATKRLTIRTPAGLGADYSLFAAIGRVLSGAHMCEEKVLDTWEINVSVLTDGFASAGLTQLLVKGPTNVSNILSIIRMLPNLDSLSVVFCTINDMQPSSLIFFFW